MDPQTCGHATAQQVLHRDARAEEGLAPATYLLNLPLLVQVGADQLGVLVCHLLDRILRCPARRGRLRLPRLQRCQRGRQLPNLRRHVAGRWTEGRRASAWRVRHCRNGLVLGAFADGYSRCWPSGSCDILPLAMSTESMGKGGWGVEGAHGRSTLASLAFSCCSAASNFLASSLTTDASIPPSCRSCAIHTCDPQPAARRCC